MAAAFQGGNGSLSARDHDAIAWSAPSSDSTALHPEEASLGDRSGVRPFLRQLSLALRK